MKKLLLIISLSIFSLSLAAQVDESNLEDNGKGYGAIMMSFRSLDGQLAIFSGGGGGFIVKDVRIGVFFNGLTNSFSKNDTTNTSYKLGCSYGGLWFGYPILKDRPLHGLAEMKFSVGNTRLINTNWTQTDAKIFWGFTPSLALEYTITDIFRVAAGIEYHYSYFPSPPDYYSESAFSSPGVFISLKLGTF